LLAEGPLRTKETDLERLLLRQAGGHDLAEQAHHFLVAERALVAVDHAAEDLRLALRPVVVHRRGQLALGATDLAGITGALADQFLDRAIDGVDAPAHLRQLGPGGLAAAPAPRRHQATRTERMPSMARSAASAASSSGESTSTRV